MKSGSCLWMVPYRGEKRKANPGEWNYSGRISKRTLVIKNRKSTFSTLLSGSIPATSLIWITKERYSIWRSRKDRVTVIDKNGGENYIAPALDVYYQRNLPNDQTLVFNLVGTYNKTHSDRIYQERRYELLLTDVNNGVKGNKYSIIGEGIYERKIGEEPDRWRAEAYPVFFR